MHRPNPEQAAKRTTMAPDSDQVPPFATADLLTAEGFRHAFFSRLGGVSGPPWDSLNVAASTGDSLESVRENIRRCALALGVPAARLYFLSQVHGIDVQVLDGTEDREEVVRLVGDITASRVPGVACGVRSADCVPILLGDLRSGAVVAVHSGWRGTVANAAAAGVAALRSLGEKPEIVAAIGPHIERCCFEVGDDVAATLAGASALGESVVDRSQKQPRIDLRRIVRAQLEAAGVATTRVEDVPGCTVCDARYFSYRRDGARSGRLLSAIVCR
jgi:hypothetical protein